MLKEQERRQTKTTRDHTKFFLGARIVIEDMGTSCDKTSLRLWDYREHASFDLTASPLAPKVDRLHQCTQYVARNVKVEKSPKTLATLNKLSSGARDQFQ